MPMPQIPAGLVGFTSEIGKAGDPDDAMSTAGGLGMTRKCSCKVCDVGNSRKRHERMIKLS
eukprot:CAMPEP_0177319668 /NCGR_PEP_ID=MMETSP0368-20130122/14730_1 /TAXON_ID=447022 ORGANISM="Scrippsiella hangoei-like, Strain SHHI-4" /NCGR_SAMPLE_ID=MMETSP0368 /ASSEMBLY_ACC=CAM_ASM_000363 /LENGTH=60 /DNA_ID=CAMNT_0018779179 /DNA_START=202 /DNA_END=381 /DNA_ORIENTATION=-